MLNVTGCDAGATIPVTGGAAPVTATASAGGSATVNATAPSTPGAATITVTVTNVDPTTPLDTDTTANTVAEGAADGTPVGGTIDVLAGMVAVTDVARTVGGDGWGSIAVGGGSISASGRELHPIATSTPSRGSQITRRTAKR